MTFYLKLFENNNLLLPHAALGARKRVSAFVLFRYDKLQPNWYVYYRALPQSIIILII